MSSTRSPSLRRVRRERALPVIAQPLGDDVAVLDPDVEQRAVPGLGRLDVVLEYPDRFSTITESTPVSICLSPSRVSGVYEVMGGVVGSCRSTPMAFERLPLR